MVNRSAKQTSPRTGASLLDALVCRRVTFHGLRHTHASQLIAAGVDIVTVSTRLGHAKPSVTLAVYAHMYQKDDSKAAAAIQRGLGRFVKALGGNWVAVFTFVLAGIRAKS